MKTSMKLDLRIVCIVLLVVIASMVALWRPWEGKADRKITTTGQAEVKAVPDEFVFYPRFDRTGTNTAELKNELNTFGTQLQTKLKEIGVKEEDITLDSSSYDNSFGKPDDTEDGTVSLAVTIDVPSKELAQKVQDYLATTDAKGQLTAMATFSEGKQRELESQARDKAIVDARSKAERTAKNLQANLGKVLEVKDATSSGISPVARDSAGKDEMSSSLPVTPGKDTVTFSVEVIFELR